MNVFSVNLRAALNKGPSLSTKYENFIADEKYALLAEKIGLKGENKEELPYFIEKISIVSTADGIKNEENNYRIIYVRFKYTDFFADFVGSS